MKLNRNGMLYAHLKKHSGIPRDFCRLFWYSLGTTVGFTLIGAAIGLLALWLIGGTVFFYHTIFMGYILGDAVLNTLWGTGAVVSILLQFLGLVILFCKTVYVLGSKTRRSRAGENVSEVYHGFKDKYCPTVEWVENDK